MKLRGIKIFSLISFIGSSAVFCSQDVPQIEQVELPAAACAQPAYKDYELFKIVMKIREITDKTIDEFRTYDLWVGKGSQGWPDANPYWDRTEQGLYVMSGGYPDLLATPWGQVKLTGGGAGKGYFFLAFGQVVLRRLHAKFERAFTCSEDRDKGRCFYELKPGVDLLQESIKLAAQKDTHRLTGPIEDYFDAISEEELNKKRGQEILVTHSYCGNEARYRITELAGQILPELRYVQKRDWEMEKNEIKTTWLEFKERYSQEQVAQ
jgi:hypothetical protein